MATTTWLGASNHSGCCEYVGEVAAVGDAWFPSTRCVEDVAPGLRRGPPRPQLITLEGRDYELELAFESGQTQLSATQAAELARYAGRITEQHMPPPELTPMLPSQASSRQLAQLVERVVDGLTQAQVTDVAPQPPILSSSLRVRLRTYSPRAPAPEACRSGATLRASVPTTAKLLRVEACRNDSCSSARAEIGRASSFVFRLKGSLQAAAYVATSNGDLLVEVRAGSDGALGDQDAYRLKVWLDAARAPVVDGVRPAAYVSESLDGRQCKDADLSFSP